MKYFEVGMPVWCAIYGEGVVTRINNILLQVTFTCNVQGDLVKNYTPDGRLFSTTDIIVSQSPIAPIVNTPSPEYNLSFAEAMEAVVAGKRVTRAKCEWYIHFVDKILTITHFDNTDSGDMYIHIQDVNSKWKIIEE